MPRYKMNHSFSSRDYVADEHLNKLRLIPWNNLI